MRPTEFTYCLFIEKDQRHVEMIPYRESRHRNFFEWALWNSAKERAVLTSFSLLCKWETLARRVGVGHGVCVCVSLIFFGSSFGSLEIGSHRFARTFNRRDLPKCEEQKKNGFGERCYAGWGILSLSFFLSLYISVFFCRARAIMLVCKRSLAIGMKVESCVEIESPGPRLYTHLPTYSWQPGSCKGPRSSSPSNRERGPSFSLLFAALLVLYLISLLLLSFFFFLFLLHRCFFLASLALIFEPLD